VQGLLPGANGKPNVVSFKMKVKEIKDGKQVDVERDISVPLIALVKVPSLNFDSLSVSFNYNISQISKEVTTAKQEAKLDISTKGILSQFVSASLVGSVEHSRTNESTSNRGGTLEVKIHVSESQLPAGLQKIIDALVEQIETPLPATAPKN
jgi:hypothetical protein